MSTTTEIERTIFNLPPDERAALAHRIWESLDGFIDDETEKAWMDEANRRWREIEDGKVGCIPAEEVLKQARAALNK